MNSITLDTTNTIPEIPKQGMPVTIITGFLGSGKTTLLNQILQNKQDLKVAVLVNEFGDINIDSQLLISVDKDMVELSNGCICCTINDGLVDAVYRVLEREERIDYLVIETTGVADPLPIILTFFGTELRDLTNIDSILTVVDAEAFNEEHFQSEAALKQITYGDIILLNKTDLVTTDKLQEVENFIHDIKHGARILHTQYGEVANEDHHKHEHHHAHEHHHHHSDHLENDGFVSISFQTDRPFDVHKFENFLTEEMPENVFRAKGILWFSDSDLRHIFQLSGPRYTLNADEWPNQPKNQVVFVGRKLDNNEIYTKLNKCLL
jgi:G3E family GTPase